MPTDKDVTNAYLAGYLEARKRAQWNLEAAYSENKRLRLALETARAENADLRAQLTVPKTVD